MATPRPRGYVEIYGFLYNDAESSPLGDDIKLTHTSALILYAVGAGYRYGFDIMEATGLPSGTVYPALRRPLKSLILAMAVLSAAIAQQPERIVLPTIAGAAVPLYPPLARVAKVEGVVHVKITTDGTRVVAAQAIDG